MRKAFGNRLAILFDGMVAKGVPSQLNSDWQESLVQLRHEGYARLPSKLSMDTSRWQRNDYNDPSNKYIKVVSELGQPNKYGKAVTVVDINSEAVMKEVLTADLYVLIGAYYRRKFWLRNHPSIIWDSEVDRMERYDQGLFHLDWCERQVSIIVLLNDVGENHTCTEFIPKSHKNSWLLLLDEDRNKDKFKKMAAGYKNRFGSVKFTGRAGDMFIMDAGNGLHRGNYGLDRWMLHFNFAINWRYNSYGIDGDQQLKDFRLGLPLSEPSQAALSESGFSKALEFVI